MDPEGLILEEIARLQSWHGRVVVDVGAGTGFWVPHVADGAQHVLAIEPHSGSRHLAMERFARMGLANVSVVAGSAEQTSLQSSMADLVVARFAYFWGPGCEAGLAEMQRILRPGGVMVVIDNDLRQGTFARWVQSVYERDAHLIDAFWSSSGFHGLSVPSCWRFGERADLEAVVGLEFGDHAPGLLKDHAGLEVEVVFRLYWRRF